MYSLAVSMRIRCGPPLAGGCTGSVFPDLEQVLKDKDLRRLLESIPANGLDMDCFQSFIDWIYCRVFPSETQRCFNYYAGEGDPLRDLYSREVVKAQEKYLLSFVSVVSEVSKQGTDWLEEVL